MFQRTLSALAASLLVSAVLLGGPANAQQTDSLRQEVETLKKGQALILKQLEALQKAIEARPAARGRRAPAPFKGADISIDGSPSKGATDAIVTLVEFSDYQCPFCRRHAANTLPQMIKDYVDTGKLRYVFRDFPIASIHPAATEAAIAARCAGAQGKYWAMHDRLFANQKTLRQRKWSAHATAIGLDTPTFGQCLADKKIEQAVKRDIAAGRKAGVTGTPAFYLGTLAADGKTLKATEMIRGARPYNGFKQVIDRLIAKHAG